MTENIRNVELIPQETERWCWAASAQMIMKYKGRDVSQVDQASERFAPADCGIHPTPPECLETGWPNFQAWGFHVKCTSGQALTFDQLKEQIDADMPVAFAVGIPGGYHMMVARGYDDSDRTVYVNDPMVYGDDPDDPPKPDPRWVPYDEYVGDPKRHTDYYNIKPDAASFASGGSAEEG